MANFYKKTHQSGRSMIEMLGVLAIIGVLSVAGIAGYSKAMTKWKLQKAVDQISMIITNVQTLFSNTNDYSALREKAFSLGILSDSIKIAGTENEAYNAFGLNMLVAGWQNGWGIIYDVPSADVCVAIGTMDWGENANLEYILLTSNDIEFRQFPISLADAVSACASITPSDYPTHIEFGFH